MEMADQVFEDRGLVIAERLVKPVSDLGCLVRLHNFLYTDRSAIHNIQTCLLESTA